MLSTVSRPYSHRPKRVLGPKGRTILDGNILDTVSFHNFKSQNFKLSVSNRKSKYVAYLAVLSQISNCQGLGRKNKHDILKTDRRNMVGTGQDGYLAQRVPSLGTTRGTPTLRSQI